MRKKFFVATLVFVFAALPLGSLPGAQAQDGGNVGITIRPSLFEFRLQPGETETFVINVTNKSDGEITFYPRIRDIESMDEGGAPIWADSNLEKSGAELSSWTTFSHSALFLQPDETVEVSVFIRVPANAPSGGTFGMASFVKNPGDLSGLGGNSGLGIGFTTGSLVSVTIGDDIIDEAILREFKANPKIGSGPGVVLESRVENLGNSMIRPIGTIEITNMFGRRTASVSYNKPGGAILPGTVRDYSTTWEGGGFLFGKYTAVVFISYGTDVRKTLVGTTTFWILPAKLLIFSLGGALVAFLIVLAWVRSYIRRKLREAGTPAEQRGSRPSSFLAVLISALIVAALALAFAFLFLV